MANIEEGAANVSPPNANVQLAANEGSPDKHTVEKNDANWKHVGADKDYNEGWKREVRGHW